MSQIFIEDITEEMRDELGDGAKDSIFLSVIDGMKINRAIIDEHNFLVTDKHGIFVDDDNYNRVRGIVEERYKELKEKFNGKTTE